MKRLVFTLVATAIVAGAGLAAAQSTPSQPDTTHAAAPAVAPPVAVPPPVATPAPAPPPPAPKPAASQPAFHRYGGISGLWTKPQGDFKDQAGDGWGILIMGEQFLNPTHMVAVTTDIGYLDFGSKKVGNTTNDFSMFPFQAGIRVYPMMQKKPDSKMQIFGQGSLGFFTTRTEVKNAFGSTSKYDYDFGTGAGLGVRLNAGPAAVLLFDANWNWVFATGTDLDYLALRGGIMIPVGH
jgi:hypothetical protein